MNTVSFKSIKQQFVNKDTSLRDPNSRRKHLQELENSFKEVTGCKISGFGSKESSQQKKSILNKN